MGPRHVSEESASARTSSDKQYQKGQISRPSVKIPDVPDLLSVGTPTDIGTNRPFNSAAVSIPINVATTGGTATGFTATSTPDSITSSSSQNPLIATGLTPGTSYTFSVRGTSGAGSSSPFTTTSVTPTSVPDSPTITSAIAVNSGSGFNNGRATVSFTSPASGGKAITQYTVTSSPGGITATGNSPVTVTGLNSNTSYAFTVTATNDNGTSNASSASSSVAIKTVPDAPVIGTVTVTNSTTVSIPFTPGATGGSSITSYTVTSSPSIPLTVSGSSSPLTVTGNFLPSVFYTFAVTAINANGSSAASAASNSVAPIPIVTDDFNRTTSGSLGTTSSGTLWQAIKGIWYANNGVAQSDDTVSATSASIAAVDLKSPLVTVSTKNSSLGTGVAFMIQDSNNWWAAVGLENDSYTYAYTYNYTASGTGSAYHPTYYYTQYYTYVVATPQGPRGDGSYYYHYGTATGSRQAQGGGNTTYYSYSYSATAYDNAPNSAAVTAYYINLYRSVAGTVTSVASTALTAIAKAIGVVVTGSTVTANAYSDNALTTSVGTASATSVTPVGNLHGIILTKSAQNQGNTTGAFSAQVTG